MTTSSKDLLIKLLENQIKLIEKLTEGPENNEEIAVKRLGRKMDTLARSMTEFGYYPLKNLIFQTWFSQYEVFFKGCGNELDDKAKVRLLLRKLNTIEYEKYVSYISPKQIDDKTFDDTTKILTEMFGIQESLVRKRYKCLQTTKLTSEDIVSYAARIDKNCENFEFNKLNLDQFKCLLFILGLQSQIDTGICDKLLSKLERETTSGTIELNKLVCEAQHIINLKKDLTVESNKAEISMEQTHKTQSNFRDEAIPGNKEESHLILDYQQAEFNINCLSNFKHIKYNFKKNLEDLKFKITEYKAHFKKSCLNCLSSFHCSTFEDGHFNFEKMLIADGTKCCVFCQKYFTKERCFYHCCNICNASFKNCKLLFFHREVEHQTKPFQCVACHLSMASAKDLTKHLLKHKRANICPYCNKTKSHLKLHILRCKATSQKKFTGNTKFYDKYNSHLLQHKNPLACNYCNKRFWLKYELKRHLYTHTAGDTPYICSLCNKGFVSLINLKKHEYLRICTGNPRRDFQCNLCSKMFNSEERLLNHMLSHTGEKPFSCKYCTKQFKIKESLDKHIFEHIGGKQFKCDLCDKTFAKRFMLNKHKNTHVIEKSFQCPLCPKVYKTGSNLNYHIRRIHK